jgi:hypothetical protein
MWHEGEDLSIPAHWIVEWSLFQRLWGLLGVIIFLSKSFIHNYLAPKVFGWS